MIISNQNITSEKSLKLCFKAGSRCRNILQYAEYIYFIPIHQSYFKYMHCLISSVNINLLLSGCFNIILENVEQHFYYLYNNK